MGSKIKTGQTHKVCPKCKLSKPVEDYYWYKKDAGEIHSRCKSCMEEDKRQAYKESESVRASHKRATDTYRSNHKEKYKEASKRSYEKNGYSWKYSKYGITFNDYEMLQKNQGNVCAICGCPPSEREKILSVDHCHSTNVVRGLLCKKCNLALGLFGDNPITLMNAAKYLQNTSS